MKTARFALTLMFVCLLLLASIATASADTTKTKSKPKAPANYTKGQTQLSGGNGEFGVVYTFKDKWNEEILSAQYTLEPFVDYGGPLYPRTDEKLLVLTVALKNASPTANFFNNQSRYTAFDQFGKEYGFNGEQNVSNAQAGFGPTLNPGQGLGQPALNDPLRIVFRIDGKSKIEKILINQARLGHTEQVLRFYMSGATVEEDGAAGDPKNIIKPLPANVRDPADPTGATALAIGNGGKPGDGTVVTSNIFEYTLDSFGDAPAGTTCGNNPPDANKKYVQAFFTVTNPTLDEGELGYVIDYNSQPLLLDADGDTFRHKDLLKASSDSPLANRMQPSSKLKFRMIFELPIGTKVQTLQFQASNGRRWNFDVSGG